MLIIIILSILSIHTENYLEKHSYLCFYIYSVSSKHIGTQGDKEKATSEALNKRTEGQKHRRNCRAATGMKTGASEGKTMN